MDVLKPETIWVDGRCYRKNPSKNSYGIEIKKSNYGDNCRAEPGEIRGVGQTPKPYREVDLYADEICGGEREMEDDCYILETTETGFKTICQNIPRDLFSLIVGRQGQTKGKLESETKTKIVVPSRDREGFIVVRGSSRENVIACRRRIDQITSGARMNRDPTHFACFPLNTQSLMEKFQQFKDSVLEECGKCSPGLDEGIFQEKEKLHLTLCVLILLDDHERNFIKRELADSQAYINSIVNGEKLEVHITGLEIMNDDPSRVDVLYAKCITKNDKLQKVADSVVKRLVETGLAKPNRTDNVKLHMTLINTRFRTDDSSASNEGNDRGDRRRFQKRESFDAQSILKKYGSYDFGKIQINEIQIAIRKTKAANGFYSLSAKIAI